MSLSLFLLLLKVLFIVACFCIVFKSFLQNDEVELLHGEKEGGFFSVDFFGETSGPINNLHNGFRTDCFKAFDGDKLAEEVENVVGKSHLQLIHSAKKINKKLNRYSNLRLAHSSKKEEVASSDSEA